MIQPNATVDGTRAPWRAVLIVLAACLGLALAGGCQTATHGLARAPVRAPIVKKAPAWTPSAPMAPTYGKTNRPAIQIITNTSGSARPSPVAATVSSAGAYGGSKPSKSDLPSVTSVPSGVSTVTNMAASAADVRLRAGLVVGVTVLVSGKREIEEHAKRVADSGTITLPMLGSVVVKDKTLDELAIHLEVLYREYFVNPQVIVDFVRDESPEAVSPWGFATVLGRVKKPGRISLPATRDLTVSGAIQQAGGFDTSAKDSAIRVTRRREDTGAIETREVNLRAVGALGKLEDDVAVQPDDVIFVPELIF